MRIDNPLLCVAIMVFAGTMTSIGCDNTPEGRIETAKDNLQEAKADVKEAVNDAVTAYRDEWLAFKFNAEAAIRDNEYTVNGYKKEMRKADTTLKAVFDKRIGELEQRNTDLKRRLAEYSDEGKIKWEGFKQRFNRDMEALAKSLKELAVDDKK